MSGITRDDIDDGPSSWSMQIMRRPDSEIAPNKVQTFTSARSGKKLKMPDFDYYEIANLIDFYQVYQTMERPGWKKRLEKQYGPCGTNRPGYRDPTEAFLWKWDVAEFGELTFDAECTLTYDGSYFYVKKPNRAGKLAKFSIALESWLANRLAERDPNMLLDDKWRYKNLWHEFIKVTQVRGNSDTGTVSDTVESLFGLF